MYQSSKADEVAWVFRCIRENWHTWGDGAALMRLMKLDAAKERLTKDGFDRAFGARPLRRKIQEVIINPLALRVLQGEFKDGDRVLVDFLDDKYVISKG